MVQEKIIVSPGFPAAVKRWHDAVAAYTAAITELHLALENLDPHVKWNHDLIWSYRITIAKLMLDLDKWSWTPPEEQWLANGLAVLGTDAADSPEPKSEFDQLEKLVERLKHVTLVRSVTDPSCEQLFRDAIAGLGMLLTLTNAQYPPSTDATSADSPQDELEQAEKLPTANCVNPKI